MLESSNVITLLKNSVSQSLTTNIFLGSETGMLALHGKDLYASNFPGTIGFSKFRPLSSLPFNFS